MRSTPYNFNQPPVNIDYSEPTDQLDMKTETTTAPETQPEAQPEVKTDTPAPQQPAAPVAEKSFLEKYGIVLLIVLIAALGFFFWKFKIVSKAAAALPVA